MEKFGFMSLAPGILGFQGDFHLNTALCLHINHGRTSAPDFSALTPVV